MYIKKALGGGNLASLLYRNINFMQQTKFGLNFNKRNDRSICVTMYTFRLLFRATVFFFFFLEKVKIGKVSVSEDIGIRKIRLSLVIG